MQAKSPLRTLDKCALNGLLACANAYYYADCSLLEADNSQDIELLKTKHKFYKTLKNNKKKCRYISDAYLIFSRRRRSGSGRGGHFY